jgi:SET domain-containing protein
MRTRKRVVVRNSGIHGRGVFAAQRLRSGASIGTFTGKPTTVDGTHVLWLVDEDGSEEGLRVTNELRYLNHSADPNAELDGLDLLALRNIQPGCEVTIDYGEAWRDVD